MGKLAYAITLVLLVSCASNPGVVQISPDTYLLAKQDNAGIFGNASAFKAEVLSEANSFASAQGKVVIPISLTQTPTGPGRFATIEYQFRVVDPTDPEVKRTSLKERADLVIETNQKSSIDMNLRKEPQSSDMYSELLKLEDLKKRGILTDAEFEAQKKRLLSK